MSFLFGRGRSKINSGELPRSAKTVIAVIEDKSGDASPALREQRATLREQKIQELAKLLSQMKLVFQGTPETESSPEQVHQLVSSLLQEDLLCWLSANIADLPFESRKDTHVIFSYVMRYKPHNAPTTADPIALNYFVNERPEIILNLCNGYSAPKSATPCGSVLREALKHDAVAAVILFNEPVKEGSPALGLKDIRPDLPQSGEGVFWKFFQWIDQGSFEVGADAFTTFRELLTKHKQMVAQYLAMNFELFFDKYNNILIKSESYVTKRQSIKLLGEILLDRSNYAVMTAYVDRGEHLKICMNLLRDQRKMVQYEGFHVFKVFVANPHKSVAVQRILLNNRDKLLKFLSNFLQERTDDEQFIDERTFLIKQINNMPSVPVVPVQKPAVMGPAGPAAAASTVRQ